MLPNTKVSNIQAIDDTFHLVFNDEIMDMIGHNTNNKITKTLSRLRNNHPAFIKSNKMGLLGMNLQRVDYLFADEGHYAFAAIMPKSDSSSP